MKSEYVVINTDEVQVEQSLHRTKNIKHLASFLKILFLKIQGVTSRLIKGISKLVLATMCLPGITKLKHPTTQHTSAVTTKNIQTVTDCLTK